MQIVVNQDVTLTQISQKFAQPLFDLVQQNKQNELCYWCPDLLTTYATIESTKFHIEDALSKFEEDRTPDFLILYKEQLAGVISLSPSSKYSISKNTFKI